MLTFVEHWCRSCAAFTALRSSDDFDADWQFHEQEYKRNHASHYADHHVPEVIPSAASLSQASRRSILKIVKKKEES